MAALAKYLMGRSNLLLLLTIRSRTLRKTLVLPSSRPPTATTTNDAIVQCIGTAHNRMLRRHQTRPRSRGTLLNDAIVSTDAAAVRS